MESCSWGGGKCSEAGGDDDCMGFTKKAQCVKAKDICLWIGSVSAGKCMMHGCISLEQKRKVPTAWPLV
eukprot:TRINITY_DN3384_c0_g1_i1.p2 TRINITY_DN3384_c0_g1~~TRINITY_DN3384_c0_g1_i1.p2  ORF type:complete len:69 (+),score=27.52 TRINITY_DN3384_c0_g1_i1:300-506(+)